MEFYSKNKLEKLVHIVVFFIRMTKLCNGRTEALFPARAREFDLLVNIDINSGAHPAHYAGGTGVTCRG